MKHLEGVIAIVLGGLSVAACREEVVIDGLRGIDDPVSGNTGAASDGGSSGTTEDADLADSPTLPLLPDASSACGAPTPGGPVLIATLPASGSQLVVDSTNLYVGPYERGVVTRISLADCSTEVLNPAAMDNVAIDTTRVYSAGPTGIISCPKTGCSGTYTTVVPGASAWGIAADSDNVYWTGQGNGGVTKAPATGGAATTLVTGWSSNDIEVVGGLVVFVGAPASGGNSYLLSVPVAGGTPTVLFAPTADDAGVVEADSGGSVEGLAVDARNAYFSTTNGVIGQVPLGGGTKTILATGQGNGIDGIGVDATDVYWGTYDGAIVRTPIGGGPVTTLASGYPYIEGLTADASNVYFAVSTGAVYRLAK